MKTIKALWILTLLAFQAAGGAALAQDAPAQVGRVSYTQGAVSYDPADAANEWMAAQLNWPVTSGDRLWADRDGRAEIRVGSNAIRAGALTSVDVLRLDDQATQLRLAQGTLNLRVRQLDTSDSFEVDTPAGAVLLTRPGSYRIDVDPSGSATTVTVHHGQADVLTGNAPVPLNDGQLATFSPSGQNFGSAPPPDGFDRWAFARDRAAESLAATRYVSPEMTGYESLDQYGSWQSAGEYGDVWFPATVAAGWAPYRDGRWAWVSPWGWTWIDDAPWGFAPFHYGRWVLIGNRWAWAPGARMARPVYAPALVAFIGGTGWSASFAGGPAVGWVPLGWREPYIPWYRHSHDYVRNVNRAHVTNVTVINQYAGGGQVRYAYRGLPSAVTVVTRDTFAGARRVRDARINAPVQALANAPVTHATPFARPDRHGFAAAHPGTRVPERIRTRDVFGTRAPLAAPAGRPEEGARVRVLNSTRDSRPFDATRHAPAFTPPAPQAAPARERPAERVQPRPEVRPQAPQPRAVQPAPAPAVDPQRMQRERQLRDEQRRQSRALQQQQLEQQRAQQHQIQQQRAQAVQQQRERQAQQAQQLEQQRQLQRQQRQAELQQRQAQHQQRQAAPSAAPRPPQPAAPPNDRRRHGVSEHGLHAK